MPLDDEIVSIFFMPKGMNIVNFPKILAVVIIIFVIVTTRYKLVEGIFLELTSDQESQFKSIFLQAVPFGI